jgi:hypothetical protein
MTIRLMRVDRIDRGRARRAWEAREAFALIIVSPVAVVGKRDVRNVRFKPTQVMQAVI